MARTRLGYLRCMKVTDATIGRALRRIRKSAGLNQIALGATIGMSSAGMSKIESGDRVPSFRILVAWLQACGHELHVVPAGSPGPESVDVSHLDEDARRSVATLARTIGDMDTLERAILTAPLRVLENTISSGGGRDTDTFVKSDETKTG